MLDNVYDWARKHAISHMALTELLTCLNVPSTGIDSGKHNSEEAVQAECMILAARGGAALWRNNSGALKDETGRLVRFGLGNTSSRINDVWKSADLIGILPMRIEQRHVGTTVGRFWAVECKEPGWKFRQSDKRAVAQAAFIANVKGLGGQATFAQGTGDLFK
jgi:hypothetical protein